MIQPNLTQLTSLPTPPAVLVWTVAPAMAALLPAARGFGFADDEADLEQALSVSVNTRKVVAEDPMIATEDFERLFGVFMA